MTPSHVNVTLVAIGSAGLVLGVRLAAWPLVSVTVPSSIGRPPGASATDAPGQPDSLVASLVARDPFRVARRPAPITYDPVRLAQPAAPPPTRPVLLLAGIVWDGGRDPAALIDGFPGVNGPLAVRQGETIAGLRVKRIAADRVVITGLDTTWSLTVREPWR